MTAADVAVAGSPGMVYEWFANESVQAASVDPRPASAASAAAAKALVRSVPRRGQRNPADER